MHHFNVLREPIERIANMDRQPIPGKFDRDSGKYRFQVSLEALDPNWTLCLGEFVYNTRASLDYLVTALIRSEGNEANETSQFPIYDGIRVGFENIDKWWKTDRSGTIKRKLDGTPAGTKAAFKTLQPFYGGPGGLIADPTPHPLFALAEMSNRDKHRRLNLLVRNTSIQFVRADRQPIYPGPPFDHQVTEPDERNTYSVTLRAGDKPDMDVYLLPAHNVRLNEGPLIRPLIEMLAYINQFIDGRVLPTVRDLML